MKSKQTPKRFKKIVKYNMEKAIIKNPQDLLFYFIIMIPIIGQLMFLILLMDTLSSRKVYWEEIKDE